ncbi:MAG TPA: hypothetical protein VFN21_10430 [Acidimicrobiales bacterium]|nr:hypothetical protein [Acidimicrobiales bacterium]
MTGLGMCGLDDLGVALSTVPPVMRNVGGEDWQRLRTAFDAGDYAADFNAAWENGRSFLKSAGGLRHRTPTIIEWKGPQRQPGYDTLPADLRIDHVYLVSCKYQSRILTNSSPANLFRRRLADRTSGMEGASWYVTCAPAEFQHLYSCVRRYVGRALLPRSHEHLTTAEIRRIREACGGSWPTVLRPHWQEFSLAVATASASAWKQELTSAARQEEMLWRLLRLGPAPYFVLGSSTSGPMRLRIETPWDWKQHFVLAEFDITATSAGQPRVDWKASVVKRDGGEQRDVAGHVEIRWAHGRFSSVEAKVYLDTPHASVPGYSPLD